MTGNIDLLLEKLSHDSLAHELVDQLRKADRQDWSRVLDEELRARLEKRVQELKDAKDQKS
ncbi:hypothetical protein MX659_05340 [Coriobacteriia bacterium Es71-Z0120]|uniref:hypothetical protein n=1 Tax=Parvivirga hydrogeniphila TaxID=2939460 RepID=UPI002260864E|nr:hypothetical protein [Parvivirga hydrogeniphila]MCL4079014.1 hypothetical protein [Parvivirga hydrogeniphila]